MYKKGKTQIKAPPYLASATGQEGQQINWLNWLN